MWHPDTFSSSDCLYGSALSWSQVISRSKLSRVFLLEFQVLGGATHYSNQALVDLCA